METKKTINYKGYIGKVEYESNENLFHGEVINLVDTITFKGKSVEELHQSLKDAVDAYLESCEKWGRDVEKPFSGQFIVRVNPELHRAISSSAKIQGISMNQRVIQALERDIFGFEKEIDLSEAVSIPQTGRASNASDPTSQRRREVHESANRQEKAKKPGMIEIISVPDSPLGVIETEHEYIVTVSIAGLRLEDLDVIYKNGTLTISSNYYEESVDQAYSSQLRERHALQFRRSLQLPKPVDGKQLEAFYNLDILTIKLPKKENEQEQQENNLREANEYIKVIPLKVTSE